MKISKGRAAILYARLPVTATPKDFLAGKGNWGLTEREYKQAKRLAQILK